MFRIDDATAATSLPTPEAAGTEGYWTEGNPATGVPATLERASWFNMIQEELRAVVVAAGLTPSKTTYNQVLSAIKRICQNTVVLADTGAANAYTAVNATPLVAGTWVDGVVQAVKIAHANTGASTYAPDGLAAIPIYGLGLQPLQGGELALNGTAILMRATIAGVNSGNPIAVLMECAGGAQQIPPGTQSGHAAQLGQAGFQNQAVYINNSGTQFVSINGGAYTSTGATTFAAPVSGRVKYRVWGAGGGSGGTFSSTSASAGGGGGAYAEGVITGITTPVAITVGLGGTAGTSSSTPTNGGTGGTSSFGGLVTCPGGAGGVAANGGIQSPVTNGGTPTVTNNAGLIVPGGQSDAPVQITGSTIMSARGGAAFGSPIPHTGVASLSSTGINGLFPGGGACGSLNQAPGGAGANGCVIVEW
jgi:hypothetical protein